MAFEFDVLIVPYRFCPNTDHGRLSVFINVVAFIASRQKWDFILFMAWLCFECTVVFNALCMLTKGVQKIILLFVTKLSFHVRVVLLSISPGTFYVGFQY